MCIVFTKREAHGWSLFAKFIIFIPILVYQAITKRVCKYSITRLGSARYPAIGYYLQIVLHCGSLKKLQKTIVKICF